jgi:hypothetical protein
MAGSTNAQIAMKMRTTQSAIQDALPRFSMRYRPDVWPPKRIAQFKKLWADDSFTQEQIAKKIGFDDAGSVGRKARALQLPARTPHWTEAEVAQLPIIFPKHLVYMFAQFPGDVGVKPVIFWLEPMKQPLRELEKRGHVDSASLHFI